MRPVIKRGILVIGLLLASAWCLVSSLVTGTLGAHDDPTAYRWSAAFLIASAAFGLIALWDLVVLLRRHGTENLL